MLADASENGVFIAQAVDDEIPELLPSMTDLRPWKNCRKNRPMFVRPAASTPRELWNRRCDSKG
jgi:hypothetical protein